MNDNNREKAFAAMLKTLVDAAKKNRNTVTQDQLEKAFAGMGLSGEDMDKVKAYLTAAGIGVDAPPAAEELLTEEEHSYLQDYEEMVRSIPQPEGGVLDAIKLSSMAGEKQAQEKLIEAMLPKVLDIAKLYAGQGVLIEDLIGAGNEALVVGVTLLAPLEGPGEVEGVLAERIMNAMEGLIEENVAIKAQDNDALVLTNKVLEKAEELSRDLGRKVSVEELAAEGEVTQEEIMEAIRLSANHIEAIDYRE